MSHEYPVRAETHVSETESLTILRQALPSLWVIREVSERDYGLDVYVEIVGDDRMMRGNLVAIQLKSKSWVKFSTSEPKRSTFHKVERATLNYWLGMPVPVFLCLVCLKTKQCFWVNVKQQHREGIYSPCRTAADSEEVLGDGQDDGKNQEGKNKSCARNPAIRLLEKHHLSPIPMGFLTSYFREREWPRVEAAIERGLTSFTSLGPLVLMCERKDKNLRCTTTLQYLVDGHFETFRTLSEHLLGKSQADHAYWYQENTKYAETRGLAKSYTFYFRTVHKMFRQILWEYRKCLIVAYDMVTKTHSEYFDQRFPFLRSHLERRPLTFLAEDWYARYFFDEYEGETEHPEKLFFEDFAEYDWALNDIGRS